jgi:DNA polymerase I-like protein with 3'-5' exonuclease and polymerase domains
MTKQAMVDIYESGKTPLLQVHDELAFSVCSEEEAVGYAEAMENAIKIKVPCKCDIDYGPSWGEATPLERN